MILKWIPQFCISFQRMKGNTGLFYENPNHSPEVMTIPGFLRFFKWDVNFPPTLAALVQRLNIR